jgi:putative DNA modification/repair radical SAM protein
MTGTAISAKLPILADAAKYDASCASSGSKKTRDGAQLGTTEGMGICHSYTPDGRCVSLLKILLTNYCIYDCKYCINRISSDTPRARFTVDEVVWLTMEFYKRNYIEGLFLSSGIIQSSDYTMEQLVAVAKTLREDRNFGGYIHLKTIPGADDRLVALAGQYADRLSVNIELPTSDDLIRLAPDKKLSEIDATMAGIRERIDETKSESAKGFRPERFAPGGQSTQMIVGATPSNDRQILTTASDLYEQKKLRRVYYSAFSPIPDAASALPIIQPPLIREHRLYQADWLMRFYEFEANEIVTGSDGLLDLRIDPKLAWALVNRHVFPIDVNKADKRELLRVPGLGAKTVAKILATRKYTPIRSVDLKKLGVAWNRAQFFVITADSNAQGWRRLSDNNFSERFLPKPKQLMLFDEL